MKILLKLVHRVRHELVIMNAKCHELQQALGTDTVQKTHHITTVRQKRQTGLQQPFSTALVILHHPHPNRPPQSALLSETERLSHDRESVERRSTLVGNFLDQYQLTTQEVGTAAGADSLSPLQSQRFSP